MIQTVLCVCLVCVDALRKLRSLVFFQTTKIPPPKKEHKLLDLGMPAYTKVPQ